MADPIYRRIAEQLRQEIESGELGRGSQLPSELQLRERFNASRNTVRDAVKSLVGLGLVETRPGQGTYVTREIDPYVTTLSEEPERVSVAVKARPASQRSARMRRTLPPAIRAWRYRRRRVRSFTPPDRRRHAGREQAPRTTDQRNTVVAADNVLSDEIRSRRCYQAYRGHQYFPGAVRYLEEKFGLKQTGYRDWITVRAPDTKETDFFELSGDSRVSVFEIFRMAFDQNGTPMRLTVTVFPADRNQFIVNVGKVPPPQLGTD